MSLHLVIMSEVHIQILLVNWISSDWIHCFHKEMHTLLPKAEIKGKAGLDKIRMLLCCSQQNVEPQLENLSDKTFRLLLGGGGI